RIHVVEGACAQQRDLAAAALFRWSADRRERSLEVADHLAHPDCARSADHRNEVVTAAVTEIRERVVLGEDRDARATVPARCVTSIRGLDAAVATRHLEAAFVEE